jgi:hypothetical protein
MNIIAYEISAGLDHIPKRPKRGDIKKFDALVYPEGSLEFWNLAGESPYTGTNLINFLGWLERLSKTDFPRNILGVSLVSKQMLDVFCSVGDFPHTVIPTRIFSYELEYETEEYLEQQILDPELCNENFVALNLGEHFDFVDRERTTYKVAYDGSPKIDELFLREPPGGFPPMFRVKGKAIYLFVSPDAKESLDMAGIKSIDYFAWDEDGSAGWVYKMPDGTEQIGNPRPVGANS